MDDWGSYLYIVFHSIDFDPSTDRLRLHELDLFAGKNFLVTIHHEPIEEKANDSFDLGADRDRRWITCRRPKVMVGGELSLDQLELSYSPTMGFYRAPVQAVANGGVRMPNSIVNNEKLRPEAEPVRVM